MIFPPEREREREGGKAQLVVCPSAVLAITTLRTPDRTREQIIMDYGAKSMAANTGGNVDINVDMDEVLKRIQASRNVAGPGSVSRLRLTLLCFLIFKSNILFSV